jgi:pimeloyl-ACP methyl ester carboxylesterase
MDNMLEVVLSFIDAILPDERFAVSGTSRGAYLAQGVVAQRANAIDGLLLRVPMVEPDDAKRVVPPRTVLCERPDLQASLTPEEESGFDLAVVQSEAFLAKLRADSIPARRLANLKLLDSISGGPQGCAFGPGFGPPSDPFLAPTLIVTGRQDAIVGYRNAWNVLELYPRATFAVLDRAGHILPVEQLGLFASLVDDWLDRVENYRHQTGR